MGEACCTVEGKEKFIHGFDLKAEGKRPLGRHRLRRKKVLKWIFKKWEGA